MKTSKKEDILAVVAAVKKISKHQRGREVEKIGR